jgi:rhomboid family GlyGly-CTERM serine protease
MGLNQGGPGKQRQGTWRAWLLPACLVLTAVGIESTGDWGRHWLSYDRAAIAHGEVWRLATGHLVHLGVSHLLLNLAGLLLVWFLVAACLTGLQWVLVLGIVIAGIDAGFWLLEPQLSWYVGLSGVLHGLLAAGIVAGLPKGGAETRILAVLIVAKLVYEQIVGPLPGSEATAGGNVIVAAHLYGAVTGVLTGGAILISVRGRAPI